MMTYGANFVYKKVLYSALLIFLMKYPLKPLGLLLFGSDKWAFFIHSLENSLSTEEVNRELEEEGFYVVLTVALLMFGVGYLVNDLYFRRLALLYSAAFLLLVSGYDVWISFGSMHEVRAFRERKKRSVWFRELVENCVVYGDRGYRGCEGVIVCDSREMRAKISSPLPSLCICPLGVAFPLWW